MLLDAKNDAEIAVVATLRCLRRAGSFSRASAISYAAATAPLDHCPRSAYCRLQRASPPPGCRRLRANGVVAAPWCYIVAYVATRWKTLPHAGETKPCAFCPGAVVRGVCVNVTACVIGNVREDFFPFVRKRKSRRNGQTNGAKKHRGNRAPTSRDWSRLNRRRDACTGAINVNAFKISIEHMFRMGK